MLGVGELTILHSTLGKYAIRFIVVRVRTVFIKLQQSQIFRFSKLTILEYSFPLRRVWGRECQTH